ncbi:MAG: HigA family addiction module antitoxin [Dehalococcoidia bacterium]
MNSTTSVAEVFSPGEYLRDELEAREWTATEFAEILGRPVQVISEILNDKKEITPETALEIGRALGTSPDVWLNLQSTHRLAVARQGVDLSPVERRARLRGIVPVREIVNRGWIPDSSDVGELEDHVAEFLGVPEVGMAPAWLVAARRSNAADEFSPAQTAWLARVRYLAASRERGTYDRTIVLNFAKELPSRLTNPYEVRHVPTELERMGVALVVEAPLRSSKIDGACMATPEGPVIALTARGNRFDSFVFTLLHELAHLVLGHVNEGVCIDEDSLSDKFVNDLEAAANELAGVWMFPAGVDIPDPITTSGIVKVANAAQVHPSLVVGRLQWEGRLDWSRYRNRIPRVRPLLQEPPQR